VLSLVINFLIFQAAWFITIFSAASGLPWYGPAFTLLWMVFHLLFFTERRLAEINILLFTAILGYLIDSLQVLLGIFSFPSQPSLGAPSTLWMVALWINLAATLNISLKWLHRRLLLAGLLGAIGGPLAYFAGSQIGALEFGHSWSLAAISLQWSIAMPLLIWFAQRHSETGLSHLNYNNSANN
jgi:hypothetical protein